jgi:Uncharacterized protein conserved in bacteria (DUF2188)
MANKQMWVSPDGNNWRKGQKSNSARASVRETTKQDTLFRAKEIVKNQWLELIVQRKDWTIQERNSYGNDPYPPKG